MTRTPTSQQPFQSDNANTSAPRMILAMGRDHAIGHQGNLLCHLSADLRRFKQLTLGHAIIMGRKTFDSLPKGALPGRRNIVVTRNSAWSAPGVETASSLDEAIALASTTDSTPYIIGGGQIYRQALPLVSLIELTLIDADFPDADTRLPELTLTDWQITETTLPAETPVSSSPAPEPPFRFLTLTHL
ncbi:MAG: dihydrofolate reductase [Muribaculaceae bacterium]|nr:dihydrofolate reductase [Muribaculaceae bacterium]